MRDSVVSPRFTEDAYKGQDVVNYGVRIPLSGDPGETAAKFSRNARRILAEHRPGLFRAMFSEDLPKLREMWFDPADPTFPTEMGESKGHVGVTALDSDGEIIGGAIWAPQGKNLFLHQLVAGERGKELQMPTRLIWESMLQFGHAYHALDIGVSYNPKRQHFFKNFAVERYPIILKRPFYVPVIRLSPFRGFENQLGQKDPEIKWQEERATFFPRGSYAIYGALKHLGVGPGDNVCIVKTFGSRFISGCVTQAIERTGATWTLRDYLVPNTKAVIAIHEFGIPVFQESDMAIMRVAQREGVPVIEDCAWRNRKAWDWSDYQIFSMQKMVNMNYGGVLCGVHLDDDYLWSIGCLDAVKRERSRWEPEYDVGHDARVANWKQYHAFVKGDGMTPDDCFDYEKAIDDGAWMPTVYLQKFESDEVADAIVARLEEFGIQAGRYWGEPVVYLPIHQSMTSAEVEYMFAVVRGYFNLCRDYR